MTQRSIFFRSVLAFVVGMMGVLGSLGTAQAQSVEEVPPGRIPFNGGSMFLNGANVAWVSFARDIGPDEGRPNLDQFDAVFEEVGDHGGNAMRLWLHTNGWKTPEWGPDSTVVGPGENAIQDLRDILDTAWEHEVGLVLCLWSFDMLRKSFGEEDNIGLNLDRNEALLRDSTLTQTYVDSALVPMVEALGDHPAVIAWEIFNEPEGMAEKSNWNFVRKVPMSDIQRFVNQAAAGIHRADEDALVTNGTKSFDNLTDKPPKKRAKRPSAEALSDERIEQIRKDLSERYRHPFTREEAKEAYARMAKDLDTFNYYRDDRLIEQGGYENGTLDFYSVHYYDWPGTKISPFHIDKDYWGLDKPVAVMEFHMGETFGVARDELYTQLMERGYAGANTWSWTDMGRSDWEATLDVMERLREDYPGAVLRDSTMKREEPSVSPDDFALRPPTPNPVRNRTTIVYDLSRKVPVTLKVYDTLGREVATLVNDRQDVNRYRVPFDASDLSSGIYFYQLRAGAFTESRRMVVVK